MGTQEILEGVVPAFECARDFSAALVESSEAAGARDSRVGFREGSWLMDLLESSGRSGSAMSRMQTVPSASPSTSRSRTDSMQFSADGNV